MPDLGYLGRRYYAGLGLHPPLFTGDVFVSSLIREPSVTAGLHCTLFHFLGTFFRFLRFEKMLPPCFTIVQAPLHQKMKKRKIEKVKTFKNVKSVRYKLNLILKK